MRAKEFLFEVKKIILEYDSIDQAKVDILNRIESLDSSDEENAKLIDKIFRALSSKDTGSKIEKAFGPPTADETMSDSAKLQHIAKVAKIISNTDADFKGLNNFLIKLEAGKLIDISVFKKSVSSFSEMLRGDQVAINIFNDLVPYGAGVKRKGPGEFALALLSPNIRLAEGQGDLEIDGIGGVELKAERSSGGGRLGMGGPTRESQTFVLEKYKEQAPELIDRLLNTNSVILNPFMKILNTLLPLSEQNAKQIRTNLCTDMFTLSFGQKYGKLMGEAFGQEDAKTALREFTKLNFQYYQEKDNFKAIVSMHIPSQKRLSATTGDELIALYDANHLGGMGSAAFLHTGQSSEVYTQFKVK
ncbi:MAG: hypothetical protein ACKVJK_21320 [Methylophagaceae bacterium]